MRRERVKSTIAVIIIAAMLLLAGWIEVKAEVKTETRWNSDGSTEVCQTICSNGFCNTFCY